MGKALSYMLRSIALVAIAAVAFLGCESEYEKHYDKAKQLKDEGLIVEAVREYMLAADANPKKARPWFRAAKLLKKIEQYTTGAKYCEKALKLDPGYVDVYPELVKMLGRSGQFDRAIEVGNEALLKKVVKRDLTTVELIKDEIAEAERLQKLVEAGKWAPGQPIPLPESELPKLPDVPTTPAATSSP